MAYPEFILLTSSILSRFIFTIFAWYVFIYLDWESHELIFPSSIVCHYSSLQTNIIGFSLFSSISSSLLHFYSSCHEVFYSCRYNYFLFLHFLVFCKNEHILVSLSYMFTAELSGSQWGLSDNRSPQIAKPLYCCCLETLKHLLKSPVYSNTFCNYLKILSETFLNGVICLNLEILEYFIFCIF